MSLRSTEITLRNAGLQDLAAVNLIVENAVMTWKLPERVKRLSLSSYRYTETDFDFLTFLVAQNTNEQLIGVAALEPANARECPNGKKALLLHGIYVLPACHRQGIGRRLITACIQFAAEQGYSGLLVKAQADAVDFFRALGWRKLEVEIEQRDYVNRYWLALEALSG